MLREFRGALTALALVVCLLLAAASFDAGIPGQALLQTLRFHVAAVLALLAVLLLISGAWWRAVLLLLPLLASVGQGATIVMRQQESRTAAADARPLFRLLSFNVLAENTANAEHIADSVIASGADVVMLMEAVPLEPYRERLLAAYPYYAACNGMRYCDTVLLSKVPLRNVVVGSLSTVRPHRLVTAQTEIGGTTLNLVLVHLVKPYFDSFAEEEVERLAEILQRLQGPLVLAGDFNAAAWSNSVDWLVQVQQLAPGPAYPPTWPVELGPLGVPLDNVFTRAPLAVQSVEAIPDPMGSNHRGLLAGIALAPPG